MRTFSPILFPLHKAAKMDALRCECGELTYAPKRWHAAKFTCSVCYRRPPAVTR